MAHPGDEYVIIDDDSDMLPAQLPRFIKTDHCHGFGIAEYVRLIEMFKPDDIEARNLRKTLEWKPTPRPQFDDATFNAIGDEG